MLTRLRISGFKNLLDVDVRFGPFTCIAGANGVGKSNLFDAIMFLSALADRPLMDAALSVRDPGGRNADVRSLFFRQGDFVLPAMEFQAEMIVPKEGNDELGQHATATATFLTYTLRLGLRMGVSSVQSDALELLHEELNYIPIGSAKQSLWFGHSAAHWRKSVLVGQRRGAPFISTEDSKGTLLVKLHQDGNQGRPQLRDASRLPRTVLSVANAAESKTALLARVEMRSWRLMQLEPTALRRPDEFSASPFLGADGSHVAATLHRLAHGRMRENDGELPNPGRTAAVYARVANRLGELIDDFGSIEVERDERRELFTLHALARDGSRYPARSLSDGTLRFLALAVLAEDPEASGLVCMEEPENGIHPERIPAILRLLHEVSMDVGLPVGPENPLRQVVVNTHSPSVVAQVNDDELLVAEPWQILRDGRRLNAVRFAALPKTWRCDALKRDGTSDPPCPRGKLARYLNPFRFRGDLGPMFEEQDGPPPARGRSSALGTRVLDRPDLLPFLFPSGGVQK